MEAAVIGAGIGGLAAALRLAVAGVETAVFERSAAPGGKMRTLPSAAGPVDAGPTVLTLRNVFDALFAEAGARLEDYVTLIREPVLARHWWPDGSTLTLTDDRTANVAAIAAFAGDREARAFGAFAARAEALFDAFDAPVMQAPAPTVRGLAAHVLGRPALLPAMLPGVSLARALRIQFRDPRLRQLFGRYATYVGGSPDTVPALLGLVWHAEARGVWRVEGGMHRLAEGVAALATERGVRFHYGSGVRHIEVQADRVAAIRLDGGARHAVCHAVFAGDPAALVRGLLGPAAKGAVPSATTEPPSHSACVWTFAATPAGPDLAHHNVFFGADPAAEFDDLAAGRLPRDPTLYVCAEDRPGGTGGPERFEIIMNAPPASGARNPEEDLRCHTRVFATLARRGMTFDPPPGPAAMTTPHDFAALYPGSAGALYGRSPAGMLAAFRRPTARTALPGLVLAGGGAHPGPGMPMAAISGRHAAAAILADRVSTSRSARTATPGGTSTASPTTAAARSRSSAS